jgi:hypothetical protein
MIQMNEIAFFHQQLSQRVCTRPTIEKILPFRRRDLIKSINELLSTNDVVIGERVYRNIVQFTQKPLANGIPRQMLCHLK